MYEGLYLYPDAGRRFKRMGLAWIVLVWIALIHSDCFFIIYFYFYFCFLCTIGLGV